MSTDASRSSDGDSRPDQTKTIEEASNSTMALEKFNLVTLIPVLKKKKITTVLRRGIRLMMYRGRQAGEWLEG